MIWKFFYSSHSGGDFGTLYQLRNKLNYTSVVSTPQNNVNACEDFLEIISAGLVTSAALGVFDRNSILPNTSCLGLMQSGLSLRLTERNI